MSLPLPEQHLSANQASSSVDCPPADNIIAEGQTVIVFESVSRMKLVQLKKGL